MSTSDLYILNGKSTTHLCHFQNGWGSAPVVWDALYDKYIGVDCFSMDKWKKSWTLHDDPRLEDHERLVLLFTFDWAYCPLENLEGLADACEKFASENVTPDKANHWAAIGAALRKASTIKHNRHARGICLSSTSVSDVWCMADAEETAKAWSIFEDE